VEGTGRAWNVSGAGSVGEAWNVRESRERGGSVERERSREAREESRERKQSREREQRGREGLLWGAREEQIFLLTNQNETHKKQTGSQ